MYRVSKDGKTFRQNERGIATYLFHSGLSPQESRVATEKEIEVYDTAHKAIWETVVGNMGLGRRIAIVFNIYDEHIVTSITIDTLLRCVEGYDPAKAAFSTYASRSLYRAFQRHLRCERTTSQLPFELLGEMFFSEHGHEDVVQFLMNRLDEYDKRILLLYYWQGLSIRQLAAILGVVKSTAWADIQRILSKCRRILKCE